MSEGCIVMQQQQHHHLTSTSTAPTTAAVAAVATRDNNRTTTTTPAAAAAASTTVAAAAVSDIGTRGRFSSNNISNNGSSRLPLEQPHQQQRMQEGSTATAATGGGRSSSISTSSATSSSTSNSSNHRKKQQLLLPQEEHDDNQDHDDEMALPLPPQQLLLHINPRPPGLVTDNEATNSDLGHVSSLEDGLNCMLQQQQQLPSQQQPDDYNNSKDKKMMKKKKHIRRSSNSNNNPEDSTVTTTTRARHLQQQELVNTGQHHLHAAASCPGPCASTASHDDEYDDEDDPTMSTTLTPESMSSTVPQHYNILQQVVVNSNNNDHQQVSSSSSSSSAAAAATMEFQQQQHRILLDRLTEASRRGRLTLINLSQRFLGVNDSLLIQHAIRANPQLSVLKLSYNNLGDEGACIIATAFATHNHHQSHQQLDGSILSSNQLCSVIGHHYPQQQQHHHPQLSLLDLGFNGIGDRGCTALAMHAVAGNFILQTLYLAGNQIREKGAVAIAGAILHGCGLASLHLTGNRLGPNGIKALASAIAERDARPIVQPQQLRDDVVMSTLVRPLLLQQRRTMTAVGGSTGGVRGIATMEEFYCGNTHMESLGCMHLSSMLLSNSHLRVLSLSNNGIDDRDMALLAQALTRNKDVPLQVLQLSFNEISCVGVECLMNAVWGSKTLREIKLDNNKVRDRGAQLCAVVLTSIDLEVLDLAFNKITTVGIRALMKSLSENKSLRSLTISGLTLDINASKAVSYALAYNCSLRVLHADNCSVGYSAQRHIVAGIVSNRNGVLRVLTGFPLGPITVTLGMPQKLEKWSNDQVLGFVRFMWNQFRRNELLPSSRLGDGSLTTSNGVNYHQSAAAAAATSAAISVGPVPPDLVAAAARNALVCLGNDDEGNCLRSDEHERCIQDVSPLVPTEATLFERTLSGTIQAPTFVGKSSGDDSSAPCDITSDDGLLHHVTSNTGGDSLLLSDARRKNRNLQWLRKNFHSLNEVGQMPFNYALLWQLHQYFFSPAYSPSVEDGDNSTTVTTESAEHPESETDSLAETTPSGQMGRIHPSRTDSPVSSSDATISFPHSSSSNSATMARALSYQTLSDSMPATTMSVTHVAPNHKRPSDVAKHSAKRTKNVQPRIAFYPRIREKLESLGSKPADDTLSLLLQLKYIESVLFQGRNVYADDIVGGDGGDFPVPLDAEMILLDLL